MAVMLSSETPAFFRPRSPHVTDEGRSFCSKRSQLNCSADDYDVVDDKAVNYDDDGEDN